MDTQYAELMVARDEYAKELGHVRFDSNFHFLLFLFGDVCELLSRTSGEEQFVDVHKDLICTMRVLGYV